MARTAITRSSARTLTGCSSSGWARRRRGSGTGEQATLLEKAGAPAEALGAFSRAEDWAAVRRLLGGQGERLADEAATWLESLPLAIIRHEPWLELASARRARAEGRWTDAIDAYGRAEAGFGPSAIALVCHRERLSLRAWFEPVDTGADDRLDAPDPIRRRSGAAWHRPRLGAPGGGTTGARSGPARPARRRDRPMPAAS